MPFECKECPASIVFDKKCLVMQNHSCFYFKFTCKVAWEIQRLLWIAFEKNGENDQCYLNRLPKILICFVIDLLQESTFSYVQ